MKTFITTSNRDGISTTNKQYKKVMTLNLPTAGRWQINLHINFGANPTGIRYICFSSNATAPTESEVIWYGSQVYAGNEGRTYLMTCGYTQELSEPTPFYAYAYQNSGGSLMAYGIMEAIRAY